MSVKNFNVNNNYLDLGNEVVKLPHANAQKGFKIFNALEQLQCFVIFNVISIQMPHCISAEIEMCDLLTSLMKELTPSR